RRRGVEEDLVVGGERLVEVRGPALHAVFPGELLDLRRVAPDQQRIRHHARAVLERDAALPADLEDRADQVLVHAHAPGDAVHDDADALLAHGRLLMAFQSGRARLAKPAQSSDFIWIIPPLMRRRTAPWLCS